mmetsp:Transcript_23130/g.38591  ORF Transcript_23130/g.38591 Transcript_23130/m.38591 type:complete len:419 (+) Transcript_23130:354-1610(+)
MASYKRVFVLILYCIFIWSIITTFVFYQHSISYPSYALATGIVPVAVKRSQLLPNVAVVFVCTASVVYTMACEGAVESLVKFSGWAGDVYIITDQPSCIDEKRLAADSGIELNRLHIKPTGTSYSGSGISTNHHVLFSTTSIRSKALKTRLFEFVDPHIEVVIYADSDIIFGVENCMNEFADAAYANWGKDSTTNGAVGLQCSEAMHDSNGTLTYMHSGLFAAHRDHSSEALRLWAEELQKADTNTDQSAYIHAYDAWRSKHTTSATVTATAPLYHPMDVKQLDWNRGYKKHFQHFIRFEKDFEVDNVYCANHISKRRCFVFGSEAIQSFVDRFQLASYLSEETRTDVSSSSSGGVSSRPKTTSLQYCPHWSWYPIEMGYISPSISMLPSFRTTTAKDAGSDGTGSRKCSKMETYFMK